ncbi:hypothetical protein LQF12_00845 [Ruania suaedae]|uniref:hypothetical protein n=1 Tax=Ruania suaedae TaxID=2897774 RepID=UPI001E292E6A|nr:hypothetical protein [Ruania suaedae]UFU03193.1 hypothetical protein LQF12_00845 [Ruania suaedae]
MAARYQADEWTVEGWDPPPARRRPRLPTGAAAWAAASCLLLAAGVVAGVWLRPAVLADGAGEQYHWYSADEDAHASWTWTDTSDPPGEGTIAAIGDALWVAELATNWVCRWATDDDVVSGGMALGDSTVHCSSEDCAHGGCTNSTVLVGARY